LVVYCKGIRRNYSLYSPIEYQ